MGSHTFKSLEKLHLFRTVENFLNWIYFQLNKKILKEIYILKRFKSLKCTSFYLIFKFFCEFSLSFLL